ncbi:MAG: hypothetical protein O3A82_17410 [Verrucomicrobia bacterium]|nr:hypothetical protein [Verrucomicrobiota bacterium]
MQNTLQILAHQGHRLSGGADRARTDDLLHAMQGCADFCNQHF